MHSSESAFTVASAVQKMFLIFIQIMENCWAVFSSVPLWMWPMPITWTRATSIKHTFYNLPISVAHNNGICVLLNQRMSSQRKWRCQGSSSVCQDVYLRQRLRRKEFVYRLVILYLIENISCIINRRWAFDRQCGRRTNHCDSESIGSWSDPMQTEQSACGNDPWTRR